MNMNENNNSSELNQNSVTPSDTDNNLNPVINNKINTENENTSDSQDKISDIVSPLDSETSPKSKKIPLTIRCPFTTQDLNIHIDPDSTVLHLKRKIYKEFPSNPKPSDQRLIFGGRIIKNDEILSEVLKRQLNDLSTPPIIHLIINSLAIQHAQTVKRPTSRTNSEHLSSNNTPSSSIQNSPAESKQDLNDIKSPSNQSLSSDNNNDIKEKNKKEEIETSVDYKPLTSTTSPSYKTSDDVHVGIDPPNDRIQYVLINNVIYSVQLAPTFSIPMYIDQPIATVSSELDNNTRADNTINTDNNNNNNNGNNNEAAQPAANADNVQQEVIIGNDDPQRQQPNQFFLIVRLAFIVYLLTQGGGYIRMIIVTFVAIIIFLVQTGRLTVTVIRNNNILNEQANNNNNNNGNNREVNNNNQAENNNENDPLLNNNNNENNDPNNNNNNPENAVQQYSFLTNCRRIFFAFFLSLIPFIQDVA